MTSTVNGGDGDAEISKAQECRSDTQWAPDEERVSWFSRHVRQPVQLLHQRYFVELVLRQKPLPPSKDGRHVPLRATHDKPLVDERRGHAYISNTIRSSRYTVWDFLPKQIIFQITRLSNFYFICIGVPQAIPGLSTTGNYTTILPLTFFILLTVLKEGYDDYKRHRMDNVENNYLATVLKEKVGGRNGQMSKSSPLQAALELVRHLAPSWTTTRAALDFEEREESDGDCDFAWTRTKWNKICVGDVLKLKRDEAVPADIILLSTNGNDGVAYVETMALDGETNLKSKRALPALQRTCRSISDIKQREVEFILEDPNKDLYDFNGKSTADGETLPLTLTEIIFRGSVLRNTGHAIGLVVNTGEECKIRMNANHHPKAKKPRLEKYANQVVLTLIAYVIIVSVGCSMGYLLWHDRVETGAFYLNNAYVQFKQIIVGFLIMFNNVIPLAMYVSLEIVKIGQMLMIQGDIEMYDEESNIPMTCNTNTILENLGQISYVLSDKTGTLTENIMRFRGISLGGMVWMHEEEGGPVEEPAVGRVSPSHYPIKTSSQDDQNKSPTAERPTGHTGVVIEEREISTTPEHEFARPRISLVEPTRRSISQRYQRHVHRTTSELLSIIRHDPDSPLARQAREFILGLALCHTAIPEDRNGKVDFQASSPDELALVRAAQDLGYLLVQRTSQKIELTVSASDGGSTETYEILDVIEFTSKRKRMSIIVRRPDGLIWLICKGADSAVVPRLRQSDLAIRRSQEVRRSVDIERDLRRRSEHQQTRYSFGTRPSVQTVEKRSMEIRTSLTINRATLEVPKPSHETSYSLQKDIEWLQSVDDSTLFTRCFRHIDDFATEGLRTLLFSHKYMDEIEYRTWKKIYQDATTSLVQRQSRIEAAAEMIEQGFDLLGASAIEDKLQKGVPETVDRLRRANIRIWMLTGDKRETAINIAHSARICQPTSLVYILDVGKGSLHNQMSDISNDEEVHKVVVVDGHTLSLVSADAKLRHLFFSLIVANIDSVIVCRASPAQKADIVKGIRHRLPGLTCAIGDGANDIAMIQAAHVGIGISGKEGLQAARVADYSISQFRFLQRLLLVHGRYEYLRTAKFILLTFWKEMFFYMMQALYQRYNGYTGTSLYEAWSLTVLNTLFTSLCVIVPGVFEQDLRPDTLLAIPELYVYGQQNQGLNLRMYLAWMVHATVNGITVWFIAWASYGHWNVTGDNGLFALGDLAFSLGIIWTNWKIFLIETHYKTLIVGFSFTITVGGWFAWNAFMSGIYGDNLSPYDVKGGFSKGFGTEWAWWLTLILAIAMLTTLELLLKALKGNLAVVQLWPFWRFGRKCHAADLELELWQEMEKDATIRERLKAIAKGDVEGDVTFDPVLKVREEEGNKSIQ